MCTGQQAGIDLPRIAEKAARHILPDKKITSARSVLFIYFSSISGTIRDSLPGKLPGRGRIFAISKGRTPIERSPGSQYPYFTVRVKIFNHLRS